MQDDTLLYGHHVVATLLQEQPQRILRLYLNDNARDQTVQPLAQAAKTHGIPINWVSTRDLTAELGDVVHQGIAAEVTPFVYAQLEDLLAAPAPQLLVALDQVTDPRNLGALVRSAVAFGAHGILMPKDNSAMMTPAAIKASVGAAYFIPIVRVANLRRALQTCQQAGLWCTGLAAEAKQSIAQIDWRMPSVVVIGAEGSGLRPLTAKTCEQLARIPIATIGSLNAATAGAIALFEAARQRA